MTPFFCHPRHPHKGFLFAPASPKPGIILQFDISSPASLLYKFQRYRTLLKESHKPVFMYTCTISATPWFQQAVTDFWTCTFDKIQQSKVLAFFTESLSNLAEEPTEVRSGTSGDTFRHVCAESLKMSKFWTNRWHCQRELLET